MNNNSLNVQVRENHSKGYAKQLRKKGYLPGVLYGQQQEPTKIFLELKEIEQALNKGRAQGLITLSVNKGQKISKIPAMIKETQTHPIKGMITHIDFYQVDLKEKIATEINIILTGEAQGVKEGGILQQQLRTLAIECLPTEIPDSIIFDIAHLQVGEHISVSDLTVPETVEVLTEAEQIVANIVLPRGVSEEADEETEAETPPADANGEKEESEAQEKD